MDIGVMVGRFQVPEIHPGHKKLIETVITNHTQSVLFIGVAPAMGTKRNPLDFMTRYIMLKNLYPGLLILPLNDNPIDEDWSHDLDKAINTLCPFGKATIYGGKDSFIPYYHGKHSTVEVDEHQCASGTELRHKASKHIINSFDFRRGVIYSAHNQYPKAIAAVDVAVVNTKMDLVLMGKKIGEDKFRFPGGFVDMDDHSYELAAIRELSEETNLRARSVKYVCSSHIDDWRYVKDADQSIHSVLFLCTKFDGELKAGDDLAKVQWVSLLDTPVEHVVQIHRNFFITLQRKLFSQSKGKNHVKNHLSPRKSI